MPLFRNSNPFTLNRSRKSLRRRLGLTFACLFAITRIDASVISARSVLFEDVNRAVLLAHDGDTVTVPEGTATWTQMLSITKNITLQGAGADKTIITDSVARSPKSSCLLRVKLSKDQLCRITGLAFKQSTEATGRGSKGVLAVYGGTTQTNNPPIPGITTQFRLDHVNIESNGLSLRVTDAIGVIDHCGFASKNQFLQVYHPAWRGADHGNGSWADEPTWGSSRFLFVEDCTITYTGNGPLLRGSDCYEGGRYVVRHCILRNAGVSGHGTEGQGRGTKQIEIYDNVFNTTKRGAHFNQLRSGSVLMHDNLMNGYGQGMLFQVYRLVVKKPRWGGANGVNPYDKNAADGPLGGSLYATGKHTGPDKSYALIDLTKHWSPDQWETAGGPNAGYVYVLRNTNSANPSSVSPATVQSNTATTITFGNYKGAVERTPPLYFNNGDSYEVRKVLVVLDQIGQGKGDLKTGLPFTPATFPNTVLEPCYSWNNWIDAQHTGQLDFVTHQGQMKEGRDFFNRTRKPDYTPYAYPHPLTIAPSSSTGARSRPKSSRVNPGG